MRSRRARGFTLIEVLAAIALLALAFAIGLGALGKSAQNVATSAALDTAVERAQTLIAEQGLEAPLKNADLSGAFDDGMHWTLEVRLMPRPTPEGLASVPLQHGGMLGAQAGTIDVFQIDVAVQYGDGRTLRLATERAQAGLPGSP
ncbi:MAG TPA: prepilin-type N-terminal cleavage/methylation domain-containing protein [Rhodanobacteraceae bacterium]|nr:prepilin-type N-terminal cleavage/methylation domain-containing protein [Rhodanobacteraceae bacterium]